MVIPEAFGCGLPVIASRIGSLASLITPGTNGLLLKPQNAEDIRVQVATLVSTPGLISQLRLGARQTYESTYRPSENASVLHRIYTDALSAREQRLGNITDPLGEKASAF